jgi:tetratricopeptide (TPR) repeat protein
MNLKVVCFAFMFLISRNSYSQEQAIDSLQSLLNKAKEDTTRSQLLSGLSFFYAESQPDTSMLLATQALTLAQRSHHNESEAYAFMCIAINYGLTGNYANSLAANFKALRLFEKEHHLYGATIILNNIGWSYLIQEDYNQAITYFRSALAAYAEMKDTTSQSISLSNLGYAYLGLNRLDSARIYLNSGYELALRADNTREIGYGLKRLGDAYRRSNNFNLSLEYYRMSIPYLIATNNDVELSECFLGLANLFLNVKMTDSVVAYAKKAFYLSKQRGFTKQIFETSAFLTTFYKERNHLDSAFKYL